MSAVFVFFLVLLPLAAQQPADAVQCTIVGFTTRGSLRSKNSPQVTLTLVGTAGNSGPLNPMDGGVVQGREGVLDVTVPDFGDLQEVEVTMSHARANQRTQLKTLTVTCGDVTCVLDGLPAVFVGDSTQTFDAVCDS